MKKLILLALVAFMAVSVSAQVKRFTPAARVNFLKNKYSLTAEQAAKVTKLYEAVEAKNIEDDKEYSKAAQGVIVEMKNSILTDEQKAVDKK